MKVAFEDDLRPRVIFIVGPTGVGKSRLALLFAERFQGEIVNADSLQVYRYLDIGTAKPTLKERAQVPHHLLDIVDPNQEFNAGIYSRMAREVVAELHRRECLPIVCGGTGLYVRALLHGLPPLPPADPALRRHLRQEAETDGLALLHERLRRIDPEYADRISTQDQVRITRALEVYELTGENFSTWQKKHNFPPSPYRALMLGLYRERAELYAAIDVRVDAMLEQGLEEEVGGILARGYAPELKPLQAIGYRQIIGYFKGASTRAEAIEAIKRESRRYAKRQLTWFRQTPDIKWFTANPPQLMEGIVKEFITL